jgi:hypothetical protein
VQYASLVSCEAPLITLGEKVSRNIIKKNEICTTLVPPQQQNWLDDQILTHTQGELYYDGLLRDSVVL